MRKETTSDTREIETATSLAHRQRMEKRFLRGPIPMMDIELASKLGGHALTVLLLVHHRAALTGSRSVTLPIGLLKRHGISRDTKSRALRALEAAALIAVKRDRGKAACIDLLEHRGNRLSEAFAELTSRPKG